jgi:hypothetical protein
MISLAKLQIDNDKKNNEENETYYCDHIEVKSTVGI